MKKLISSILSIVMVLSLSVSVFGADLTKNVVDGTYKITVGPNDEIGFVTLNDENDEVVDYVIMVGNGYGYLYFDNVNMADLDIYNAELELISEEDLGVSGYHVFEIVEGQRDYDTLVDKEVKNNAVNEEDLEDYFA